MIELSQGTLLGARIHYAQPRTGYYRTGIEPVLLAAALAPNGTLTLVLPAPLIPEAIALAARADLRQTVLYPLHPRAGRAPKIALLQARHGRTGHRAAAGLVLHTPAGSYTDEAEAILREGQPIDLSR